MSRRRTSAGSAFGLALVAMLVMAAFSASAAQASPVWHINGKTLEEAKLTKTPYQLYGTPSNAVLTFDIPSFGVKVVCNETVGTGYLEGKSSGTAKISGFGCAVQKFEKVCTVAGGAPSVIKLYPTLGLKEGGKTGVIETMTPGYEVAALEFGGEECPLNESVFTITNGGYKSLEFEVGPEANKLPLTSLGSMSAAYGGNAVYISLTGPIVQQALEPQNKIGAW